MGHSTYMEGAQNRPKFYFLLLLPLFAVFDFLFKFCVCPLYCIVLLGTPTVVRPIGSRVLSKNMVKKEGLPFYPKHRMNYLVCWNKVDEYEHYKNQNLFMKVSVIQGHFGTYIQKINPSKLSNQHRINSHKALIYVFQTPTSTYNIRNYYGISQ